MDEWMKKMHIPCAAFGAVCLFCTMAGTLGLLQGGWPTKIGMTAAMLLLAGLALFFLRFEGFHKNTLLVMLAPIGIAILIRVMCLDFVSADYNNFLQHWAQYFRENGGFAGIAQAVGDYNVPYLYFMAFISYIPVLDLYLIKLFSLLFDMILAWGCLRLTRSIGGEHLPSAPLIAFAVSLLLPTVILNGSLWGQCDAIYAALVIHAAALLLEGKNNLSVMLISLAFSFKLQTIFLLPLWGVLWLAGKVKFRELLIFPLTYVVTIIPAVLLGKPFGETLLIYLHQTGEYPWLTLNSPTIFQFLPRAMTIEPFYHLPVLETYANLGVTAAGILVLAMLAIGLRNRNHLDRETIALIAMVLSIGVPFLLPRMHARYFFLADVITLCLACSDVRRFPAALLVQASSAACYRITLRGAPIWQLWIGENLFMMIPETLLMLSGLVFAVTVLTIHLKKSGSDSPAKKDVPHAANSKTGVQT